MRAEHMPWWQGCTITPAHGRCTIDTLASALDSAVNVPTRESLRDLRMPITGVFQIKGVGMVVTGRIAQGSVKSGEKICFAGSGPSNGASGSVASCEMHHHSHTNPSAGDIVGLCIKGVSRSEWPRVGDVLCSLKSAPSPAIGMEAQVSILSVPNALKLGWAPLCYVHTAQAPLKLSKIMWKMGQSTGGKKLEDPHDLHAGDVAMVQFQCMVGPLLLENSDGCAALARFILVDGHDVVGVGKVVRTWSKEDSKVVKPRR